MIIYKEKKDCCGCSACSQICPREAIEMKYDEEGFLYPHINESKCIECGLCKKICAFQNENSTNNRLEKILVYAAKSKNDTVRMLSSSGGMFSIFATEILRQNGVVYGAAFEENFKVKHIRTDNEKEFARCRGSKYSQSEIGTTYRQVKKDLEDGKKVLFSGTPCQIAGINRYLGDIDKKNLLLIDIVCHGTPSPKLFNDYIGFIEKDRRKKVVGYNHRSKTNLTGEHTEEIIYENGKKDSTSRLSQTWKRIFYTNLPLRPSCYVCKYTNLKRPSDITIADFWGIEKYDQEIYDKKGISLLIVNTEKGKEFYKKVEKEMTFKERDIKEAFDRNPQLEKPILLKEEERKKFWEVYERYGIKGIAKKYGKYTNMGKIKNTIKKIMKK